MERIEDGNLLGSRGVVVDCLNVARLNHGGEGGFRDSLEEVVRRPTLENGPVAEDDDVVRVEDRSDSVGNNDERSILKGVRGAEGCLNRGIRVIVNVGSRLIQKIKKNNRMKDILRRGYRCVG